MDTTDTLIGSIFDGRYRMASVLGRGGMATVYLAEDETLGRQVAIKVLDARHSADEAFVERFMREAQSAARLNHPNIVQVYDRGNTSGTYYIAMEYVEGMTLKDVVRRRGALSETEVVAYGRQAASALRFAHRNGIVHRDVKPQNMLVDTEGRLKIADFGIARAGADTGLTEVGSIVGTAQYLSPEQATGGTVTAASDLYSLGVVLYELATGRVPFDGDSPVAVALRHVNDVVPRPSQLVPGISASLEAVIMRALAKDPAIRYGTADELLSDLDALRTGGATSAMTTVLPAAGVAATTSVLSAADAGSGYATAGDLDDYPEPEPEPERKRRWWLWMLLVLVALAGGALAWTLTSGEKEPVVVEVVVPDVVGSTRDEATARIEDRGLEVGDVEQEFSTEQPAGRVISQSPAGKTTVEKGSDIDIVVSKGAEQMRVPDVVGKTRAQAVEALSAAGFKDPRIEEEFDPGIDAGRVIRQTPSGGADAAPGTQIILVVSKGAESVQVPDVTGLTESAATSRLESAGFRVSSRQVDSSEQAGIVLAQSPAAGSEQDADSTVTISIASGFNAVPNVIDMSPSEAEAAIQDAGFTPQVGSEIEDPAMSPGDADVVTEQSPAGDERRRLGGTIQYTIAHAPAGP